MEKRIIRMPAGKGKARMFQRRYQDLREQSMGVLREAQARGDIRSDMATEAPAILLFAGNGFLRSV